jgi:hypothetical protein
MHSRLGAFGDLIPVDIRKDVFKPLRGAFSEVVKGRSICGVLRYDGCKYSLTLEIEGRSEFVVADVPLDVYRNDLRANLRSTVIEALRVS